MASNSASSTRTRDGEIVGLDMKCGEYGRPDCLRHTCCSEELVVGSYVSFEFQVLPTVTGELEHHIKVCEGDGGRPGCVVGYIPRAQVQNRKAELDGKYGKIVELYRESTNLHKKRKNSRLQGVAAFVL